jgi:uncharacterized repeat protein (TIGR02543 family)
MQLWGERQMKAKKFLSVFLALTLAVGLIPATALTASASASVCDIWGHDWDLFYSGGVICKDCGIVICEVYGHGNNGWQYSYNGSVLVRITCGGCRKEFDERDCNLHGHEWRSEISDGIFVVTCRTCGGKYDCKTHEHWWSYDDDGVFVGICEVCGEKYDCEIHEHFWLIRFNDDGILVRNCRVCGEKWDCESRGHDWRFSYPLECRLCNYVHNCITDDRWRVRGDVTYCDLCGKEKVEVISFDVTFNLGGGTRTGGGQLTQTIAQGGSATAPTATRTGYSFNGWDRAFDNITGNITVNALWTADIVNHTVTFNLNGGTRTGGGALTQTIAQGGTATAPVATRTGFTFNGWDRAFNNITGSITVNALWTAVAVTNHTVTFNLGGGTRTGGGALTQTIAQGGTATAPTATRTGYTFNGWDRAFDNITGNITVNALWTAVIVNHTVTFNLGGGTRTGGGELTQTIAQGGSATAPTATRTGFTFNGWDRAFDNITGNITVNALWTAVIVNHTVTFNPNNGTLAAAQRTRTVNQGSAVGSLPTPTRTGHTFAGWFTAATGGTQITAATIINANTTYFARWTAQTFTITYNRNGGTNPANAPARYTFGTSTTLPTPTRAGHTFAGWFNNANFTGSRITSTGTARTGNLTLFARWNINRYTVTFDVNGGSALSAANRTRTRDHNATVGSLPTPTRANHTFAGWFTTRTGGTRITTTQRITANTTYFARWIANPARPANPRATANSRTEITVSWNRVTGATGYEVWRSTSANGTFTRVRDVQSGSTLSWRNTGLVADRQYFYRVRAYTTVNGVKAFSPYTATFNARTRR